MKDKNCLIFGGSGQIGRNLIRKLAKNNYRITVVTRNIHQKGVMIKTQANAGYINIVESSIFDEAKIRKLFEKSWRNFPNTTIGSDAALSSYEGINRLLYREFIPTLLTQRYGAVSQGFISGNKHVEITEDDLTYVGPNGEEPYEDFYVEEDAVLGRSKTSNPRVHFLDPAKYGGSYLAPQIYIEHFMPCLHYQHHQGYQLEL